MLKAKEEGIISKSWRSTSLRLQSLPTLNKKLSHKLINGTQRFIAIHHLANMTHI